MAKEVGSLLDGMLHGRHSVPKSLGFIARCCDKFPHSYSRNFLTTELKRRFYERRSAPKPGFQLTLDYAKSLDGIAFEEWLIRLLRDAGVPGVCKTQDSRDQGADIVITIGNRKIVVQAKQYQDTLGNKSVQEAFTAMHFYDANEAWVVTTATFSKDAIDLANRTGVHLVDGSRLMNLPELLRGPIQTVTDESALSGQPHPTETPETRQSARTASQTETAQASPIAPNDLGNVTVVSEVMAAMPAEPPSSLRGSLWRDQRLVGIGVGAIVLLSAIVGYQNHVSQQKIASEQGVRTLLESYQNAERSRDPQLLADCYAPEVETFYRLHNVPRIVVLLEFQRAFAEYTEIKLFAFSRIAFHDVSGNQATATLEREWDLRGTKNYAGAESEQMIFQKIDGNWRIVSERELKVYWTQRKNP
ncbi:MAG: restriction endonuclease [Terracidiphilus sp.]